MSLVVVLLVSACARTPSEKSVIEEAAAALGGAQRIRELQSFVFHATGTAPNAGQNRMPDDELPVWKIHEYVRLVDLAQFRSRVNQTREAQFLFAGDLVQQQTQGVSGDVAWNEAPGGKSRTRVGVAAAKDRRLEMLHHPITVVHEALDSGATVSNVRREANEDLVDITTPLGDEVTLAVDRSTHLPTRVISMASNPNMGDVAIVTTFGDYKDVFNFKMPHRLTTKMDKYLQLDLQVGDYFVEQAPGGLRVPSDIESAPAPEPSPVVVTSQPVAKGIWWLAGSGNHRSIVFDAAARGRLR